MERPQLLLPLLLLLPICLFSVGEARGLRINHKDYTHIYNHTLAKILVEYASAVYVSDLTALFTWTCSRCNDMTTGFEMIEVIVDVEHCLQAYAGVAHDLNAVIVVFRGTQEHSLANWISDLFWKQLDLNYPGMPDAMVHHGFYSAYHNTTLRPSVVNAVKKSRELYGDIQVIVLGHSMGGAIATFCALDLDINYGIRKVQLMTFGQPRVGNAAFASYFSKHVPRAVRVTNDHDIVPHLPPYYYRFPHKTYHHFPREVWLHNIDFKSLIYTVETICDSSGEDPSCSRLMTGALVQLSLMKILHSIKLILQAILSCQSSRLLAHQFFKQLHKQIGIPLSNMICSLKVIKHQLSSVKIYSGSNVNHCLYIFFCMGMCFQSCLYSL